MLQKLIEFFRDEEGATAVEYCLMVSLIAAVIVGAVALLGANTNTRFDQAATEIIGN